MDAFEWVLEWVLDLGGHVDGAVGDDGDGDGEDPVGHNVISPGDDSAAIGGFASSGDTNNDVGTTTTKPAEANPPSTHEDGSFEVAT